jgi:hypothetical protein
VTGDAAFSYGKTSHAVGALMASRLQSLIGKFDRSGVSGSTGRGRSQALESKVRFADDPPRTQNAAQRLFTSSENIKLTFILTLARMLNHFFRFFALLQRGCISHSLRSVCAGS